MSEQGANAVSLQWSLPDKMLEQVPQSKIS